ncbi:McrC family protein [Deinococcus roseus]|uniref:Restriction endonuclease n=1 Tax=Deinococcus roseus TaxID=392414 RepID=A0ABQ2CYZ5_9DEIO|nr:hypothetical protein [Deinococcus roseus]GGJ23523.1 hypothetical protein GCM10008938_07110 [Deinococcus roseus]
MLKEREGISLTPDFLPLETLFEHQQVPLNRLLKGMVPEETLLAAIEELGIRLGNQDAFALHHHKGQLMLSVSQFVGVVDLPGVRLQILPKIHRSNGTSAAEREAKLSLLALMEYAYQLPLKPLGFTELLKDTSLDWFEVLSRIYATTLHYEYQQGSIRNYQSIEESTSHIKGKILLSESLKYPARRHQLTVQYELLSSDNLFNQTFRHVTHLLLGQCRTASTRQVLHELLDWMDADEVQAVPITLHQVQHLELSRLHDRFQMPWMLARLFLENQTLDLLSGDAKAFSFLFDMNRLFETFLTAFLTEHWTDICPEALQGTRVRAQGQEHRKHLAERAAIGAKGPYTQKIFALKPDVLFSTEKAVQLIMDLKYKPLSPRERKLGVQQADMYQMLAYAVRHGCPHILLMYPKNDSMDGDLRERFIIPTASKETTGDVSITVSSVDLSQYRSRRDTPRLIRELKDIFHFATHQGAP